MTWRNLVSPPPASFSSSPNPNQFLRFLLLISTEPGMDRWMDPFSVLHFTENIPRKRER
ncbi:hypothetical protein JHK84_046996 [Glycine max]|nr:hypothetical protein JHK86_046985 [Glycine max]KAG5102027.1 hypothetical protein JHK84_046996 [Glycine max]KHN18552.1 hypothetical protein glysoja_006965 [Glycine soja]